MEYEKIGGFTSRLQNEFPHAKFMTKNAPPDEIVTSSEEQFVQICNVKPVPEQRDEFEFRPQEFEIPEKVMSYYLSNDVRIFTFDRPIHKGPIDKDNEFKSLWIERTTLITATKLPGILRWFEVSERNVITISPIKHACEMVENMNKELQKLIISYTSNSEPTGAAKNISPLSMRLQGVIEAAVNGGISKYQDAFFNPLFLHANPDQLKDVFKLKQLILQKVWIYMINCH